MNLKERIKETKETGLSLTILIILNAIFVLTKVLSYSFANLNFSQIMIILLSIMTVVTFSLASIIFESKGQSVVAHSILLVVFLGNYFRDLYTFIVSNYQIDFLTLMEILIGVLASVYAVLKIWVHRDELKKYVRRPNDLVFILTILALLSIYISSGFNNLVVFSLLFLAIITSAKSKELLILVLVIFINSFARDLSFLFYPNFFDQSAGLIIKAFIYLLIDGLIITYTFLYYIRDKDDDDYIEYEYTS